MNVEARLRELIGPTAGRLHTARSRNDQVARRLPPVGARRLPTAPSAQLQAPAERPAWPRPRPHADALMPGFTHLQPAQPVTFGHHLMAYVEMFGRDAGSRFARRPRADERVPAGRRGPGRLALPHRPRTQTAAALGFDRPTANSLDSVSDRDFALEALSAASISRHPPVAPGRGDRAVDDAACSASSS